MELSKAAEGPAEGPAEETPTPAPQPKDAGVAHDEQGNDIPFTISPEEGLIALGDAVDTAGAVPLAGGSVHIANK